jgi:hypothetical protein
MGTGTAGQASSGTRAHILCHVSQDVAEFPRQGLPAEHREPLEKGLDKPASRRGAVVHDADVIPDRVQVVARQGTEVLAAHARFFALS